MLSPKVIDDCLAKLGMLRFFPVNNRVVAEVGRLLNETCKNDKEATHLTAVIISECSEWTGPAELKGFYNREFRRPKAWDPSYILGTSSVRS